MQFGIDNKYKGAKGITFQGHSNALDQQNFLGVAKSLPKFARTQKQFIFQVRDNNHIRWCYEKQFAQIEPQNRLLIILELVTYIGSLLLNTNAYNRVPRGVNNIDSEWKKPTRSPPLSQKSPFKLERKGMVFYSFFWIDVANLEQKRLNFLSTSYAISHTWLAWNNWDASWGLYDKRSSVQLV